MDEDATNHVKSVHRTFDIIDLLVDLDEAGVTELAENLDLSVSAVHNYLDTLNARGYVVKEDQKYRLANRFIHIGDYTRHRLELFRVAESSIDWLADTTDVGSVNLIVEEHGRGVYIVSKTTANTFRNYSRVRRREYLHSTASGKAILSQLSRERVEDILDDHGLPRRTEKTIRDRDEFMGCLEAVRERGHAYSDEENTEGIRAVGAPIGRANGSPAAISVSGPIDRFPRENFYGDLPERLCDVAKSIEVDIVS